MRTPAAPDLLQAWERGRTGRSVDRALILLAAGDPLTSVEELASLSIGERDSRLLELRTLVFGARLSALATCPKCGQRLEFDFNASDIPLGSHPDVEPVTVRISDYEICFRLPNTLDMASIADDVEAHDGVRALLRRIVLQARLAGAIVSADELPDKVVVQIEDEMSRRDPAADVKVAVHCTECGHRWEVPFDIVSFFWKELHGWAVRLFYDIHRLASAYGWSEQEILRISPWRRNYYLEMLTR